MSAFRTRHVACSPDPQINLGVDMSRTLTSIGILAAFALAACDDADPGLRTLTTEHGDVLVQSEDLTTSVESTITSVEDGEVVARVTLDRTTAAVGFVWLGDTPVGVELPAASAAMPLEDWNQAAYGIYQLELWTRSGTEEEEYCHQNAAGVGCRGACGAGCAPCPVTFECAPNNRYCGGAGAGLIWFRIYNCYSRPCCVTHDACYDSCGNGFGSSVCRRWCDAKALWNGCSMADADATTGGKADATPAKYQHPTGIPCTVEGAVTDDEPRAQAHPQAPAGGEGSEQNCTGDTCLAPAGEPPREPPGPELDPLCTDQAVWEAEVQSCPEDGACTSCVWGS